MNLGAWILLFVVVMCVIALIIIAIKGKKLEESMSYGTDPHRGATTNKSAEEDKDGERRSQQRTIYEYCSLNKMRICALCDGENDAFALQCHICGHPLK